MIFKKIDRLKDRSFLPALAEKYPSKAFISAARGINILGLKNEVIKTMEKEFIVEEVTFTSAQQKLIAQLYDVGEVLERSYENNKVILKLRLHRRDKDRLQQLLK